MQRSVQRKQRGIALVMVLWVLILLGLVAASFLRETRLSTGIARNASENAKAEALAEAGIQRAMLGLADSDVTAWRLDGTPYQFALGDGTVVVRIQDEGGKVDLNLAPPPLLQGLLQITGVEANAARNLLDAIVDFRDPDSNRLPGGAEDPEYAAAGRDGGAKDACESDRRQDAEPRVDIRGAMEDLTHRVDVRAKFPKSLLETGVFAEVDSAAGRPRASRHSLRAPCRPIM